MKKRKKNLLIAPLVIVLLLPVFFASCTKGEPGLSAYEIYLKYHPEYTGSEEDWINSIVGDIGKESNSQAEEITASETGLFIFGQNSDGASYTLVAYTGVDRRVDIPDTYKGCPVTIIGDWAFKDNPYVETVYVPSTVTYIEACAFQQSSLKFLYIPSSVECIEYQYIANSLNIYYAGDEEQWEDIMKDGWNGVTMHFNHKP